jgi:hypothetical protein
MFTAHSCPSGYSYVGQVSDGRTCHGIITSGEGDFDSASCASDNDFQRTKYTPDSSYKIDRFRREFL